MKHQVLLLALLVTFNLASSQNIPSYIPVDGLVAWYPFNGNADDESGNGNQGIVTGAALTADRNGVQESAYFFDKQEFQKIDVQGSETMNNVENLTLSMWINIASYGAPSQAGYNQFINKYSFPVYHYIFANNTTGLYFYYSDAAYFQSYVLPPLDQWCHLALTYNYSVIPDDSWCHIYIDGAAVDSFAVYQPLVPSDCPMEIGSFNNLNTNTVDGVMDDIAIWNRALTPQEIMQVFLAITTDQDENTAEKFSIYPNPVTKGFKIISNNNRNEFAYSVFDITGQVMMKGIATRDKIIDAQSLLNGFYFVQITSNVQPVIKFIKR
ncbi:MAG: T9SS type A sorting domain-containing protein [Bacteroidales bacterium]|nr:T9SS type A sorting domain-containing protein [Bacteroidales bacterium]